MKFEKYNVRWYYRYANNLLYMVNSTNRKKSLKQMRRSRMHIRRLGLDIYKKSDIISVL